MRLTSGEAENRTPTIIGYFLSPYITIMEQLERIWDLVSNFASAVGAWVERSITGLFGSSNARYLKRLETKIEAINSLEPRYEAMTDAELRAQTDEFKHRLSAGETLDDLLIESFAVCREAGRRFLRMRHYDVQLIGGMVLHSGAIAEMITGEGKTLVATLPAYLNALDGKGVHVITVNDYLARRDMEWMGPLYMGLGLTVGAIQSGMESDERQRSYACDITYGTNNEFGFDYLRDNMRMAARGDERFPRQMQQSQGRLNFAIVDEVDNILIDEARTPLIISGPAHDDVTKYARADKVARQLKADDHFEVQEKEHTVSLTESGVRQAEKLAGVESFYTAGNMEWPHLIDNALKAHYLYKLDVNYVVQQGDVVIVDEFTGRLMPGRQWSDGLHQAVEAKEGVRIKEESQTLATVTLQNFFKLYNKLGGMTGTAMTEANEFWKIYKLDVIAIPPNRVLQRLNHSDVIFRTEREKWIAVADEIERISRWDSVNLSNKTTKIGSIANESNEGIEFQLKGTKKTEFIPVDQIQSVQRKGLPILVGTVSIEKSERLASLLDKRGVTHQVLNAKQHQREADIVAQAGRLSAVTIATNMAGRGTDIILGGNAETMAWAQLQNTYETRLDVPKDEWDNLINTISERENMKTEGNKVREMGGLQIVGTERHESRRIDLQLRGRCGRQGDPGSSRFYLSLEDDLMRIFAGEWVKNILTRLGMQDGEAIESKMVTRRVEAAQKKVEERNFEIRKNLLEYDEVMDEQRKRVYGFRQRILEGRAAESDAEAIIDRDGECRELILEMVDRQIDQHIDTFLDRDYGAQTFAGWASSQLSCELDSQDFRGLSPEEAIRIAHEQATRQAEAQIFEAVEENLPQSEDERDWNWSALASFANARWKLSVNDRDLKRVGRNDVAEWLQQRASEAVAKADLNDGERFLAPDFGVLSAQSWTDWRFAIELRDSDLTEISGNDPDPEAFKEIVREKAREAYQQREIEYPVLVGLAHFTGRQDDGSRRVDRDGLVAWAKDRFDSSLDETSLSPTSLDKLKQTLCEASARRYKQPDSPRTEMQRMERAVLLQILDNAWKDHLLAMDHLRSSVGLRGYAQVDPKVEYKREGMRTFDLMWSGIDERVIDIVYRIEQVEEDALRSTWRETAAIHEDTPSASQFEEPERQVVDGSESGPIQPIRNSGQKVGRNDPCPCGSGKKYKNCCARSASASAG
ncbi:MAG: SEC-C metal-binding domain-containing protein [Pirellulales bacterium]|nr:SEC-C metal-binding domain-containing protein [Pirellulales bacterium]